MIAAIVETKREEIKELRKRRPGSRRRPVHPVVFDPAGRNIIAELKRKSPSAGFIGEVDAARIAVYSKYAKAISVLTDRTYFGGSLDFLREVTDVTDCPVLCKDFIIDPVQIDFAHAAGADMVLLIARILSGKEITQLSMHAHGLGLACLVEVHHRNELAVIEGMNPAMVGVNARDLDTLAIDLNSAARLLLEVIAPVRVAESGIKSRRDMERMKGADAFLIGETLMRSKDVEATFRELLDG